jgi:hypothetical protein
MNRYEVINPKIHVVYDGRNIDLTFAELFPTDRLRNIGIPEGTEITADTLTQAHVRTALAQHFDVGINEFNDHHIDFAKTGNITVRPNTVFGRFENPKT